MQKRSFVLHSYILFWYCHLIIFSLCGYVTDVVGTHNCVGGGSLFTVWQGNGDGLVFKTVMFLSAVFP